MDERERRLRAVYGPPSTGSPGPRARPPARRRQAIVVLIGALALGAAALLYLALTPARLTAPGCWWCTASTVAGVTSGSRGCVRGFVVAGSSFGDSSDSDAYRLSYVFEDPDSPARRVDCPLQPGEWVVARYHAVSDDGRLLIVVDACR